MMKKREADPEKRARKDYEKGFRAVRAILLEDWDPLGVKDEAPDGYNGFASQMLFLARTGASADDLAGHLAHIETSRMGLSAKAPKHRSRCRKSGKAVFGYFLERERKRKV